MMTLKPDRAAAVAAVSDQHNCPNNIIEREWARILIYWITFIFKTRFWVWSLVRLVPRLESVVVSKHQNSKTLKYYTYVVHCWNRQTRKTRCHNTKCHRAVLGVGVSIKHRTSTLPYLEPDVRRRVYTVAGGDVQEREHALPVPHVCSGLTALH